MYLKEGSLEQRHGSHTRRQDTCTSQSPSGSTFVLDILVDLDNWPLGSLFPFLFFHALKSSCYVLNLPIKSEPIKHFNPETEFQAILSLSLFLSLPSTPMCISVLHASRSRRAKEGGWITRLWSLPKKKFWTEGMRKGFQ